MPSPAPRLRVAVTSVAIVVGLAVTGCSDPKPDPAQERRDRIEERLRSFSAAQSDCILDRLEPADLRALDKSTGLEPDSEALAAYSEAVALCVTDPDAATSTTAARSTTTAGG